MRERPDKGTRQPTCYKCLANIYELRPKTGETISSAYKWGKTVLNGEAAAWEPTSSNFSG